MNGVAIAATTQILNAGGWTATHTPDIDGDGRADILWQHTDGTVALWTMNGATMTSGSGLLGAGTGWSATRTGDFDGDGKADLLCHAHRWPGRGLPDERPRAQAARSS